MLKIQQCLHFQSGLTKFPKIKACNVCMCIYGKKLAKVKLIKVPNVPTTSCYYVTGSIGFLGSIILADFQYNHHFISSDILLLQI